MRPYRPRLESLEGRSVPAAAAFSWADAAHLTLSFAPDGTDALGHASDLAASLGGYDAAAWQRAVLQAFQTWAAQANINIGLVADDGSPFGAAGLTQGDPRFGDIRVGGFAFSPEALALAAPADLFAGTWTGDVLLNTASPFTLGGDLDLYTVLLHEAGHVLGLGHSDDPASVMAPRYSNTQPGLAASDVAAIQALYGARQPDAFEGPGGNDTAAAAADLAATRGQAAGHTFEARGDVTAAGDVDFYTFRTTGNTGSVTVTLRTAGLSLLQGRLSVYDAAGNLLAARTADGLSSDLSVTLGSGVAGRQFFVRVEAAAAGVFGVGGYVLGVDLATSSQGGQNPPGNGPPGPPDHGGGGPTPLQPERGFRDRSFYQTGAELTAAEPAGLFRVKAPPADKLLPGGALLVTVQSSQWPAWQPQVSVRDRLGNPVPFDVLIQGDGTTGVQVRGVAASADYVIEVAAASGVPDAGGLAYTLTARFNQPVRELATFAEGVLDGASADHPLALAQNQLLYLLAHGDGAALRVSVLDADGGTVAAFQVPADSYLSGNVFLRAGSYTIRVERVGGPGAPIAYRVAGKILSDPIGPREEDILITPPLPPADPVPADTTPPPTTDPVTGPVTDPATTPPSDSYTLPSLPPAEDDLLTDYPLLLFSVTAATTPTSGSDLMAYDGLTGTPDGSAETSAAGDGGETSRPPAPTGTAPQATPDGSAPTPAQGPTPEGEPAPAPDAGAAEPTPAPAPTEPPADTEDPAPPGAEPATAPEAPPPSAVLTLLAGLAGVWGALHLTCGLTVPVPRPPGTDRHPAG